MRQEPAGSGMSPPLGGPVQKLRAGILVLGTMLVPAAAFAQMGGMNHNPTHEFGVDLAVAYSKPSGGSSTISIFTPVDVRVGFLSTGMIQPEARLTLGFSSGGGSTGIAFDPGLNLL